MAGIGHLIERMIAAGISPGDAGAIAAEIYAAGVASASVRSAGAERTRRWRENKASQRDANRHQTSHCDAETEASPIVTERHKPSQCDNGVVLHRDTNIKNSKRQNSDRPSRGTRIDPNWMPSEADRLTARNEGFTDAEIDREALRFRDYWVGRAGSGGVKLDWAATWRNWVRTSAEKLGKTPIRPDSAAVETSLYLARSGSEELDAWDAYTKQRTGKTLPRNRDGHWRVPARWPPGYTPQPAKTFQIPDLRMQTIPAGKIQ
jgi:hypothetical protein